MVHLRHRRQRHHVIKRFNKFHSNLCDKWFESCNLNREWRPHFHRHFNSNIYKRLFNKYFLSKRNLHKSFSDRLRHHRFISPRLFASNDDRRSSSLRSIQYCWRTYDWHNYRRELSNRLCLRLPPFPSGFNFEV